MGLFYYGWVFRRALGWTLGFFGVALLGWWRVMGTHAYLHFMVDAVPVWAMLFVAYASRYRIKQTYYLDVLGRDEDRSKDSG